MTREFEIQKDFELEVFGLLVNISVTASAEVSQETFAYHNGFGDIATAAQPSVEIMSLQIHWNDVMIFDDQSDQWMVKVPPSKKDEIKRLLMMQVQAYAEAKAASFARND